ncbi:MAG: mercuric reductase [Aridibacter sp.]
MKKTQYDAIIIGGGQAGIPLAHALADAKQKVALIERKHLGGSCVNFGCTPTKSVIHSARVAHLARRAAEFGLIIPKVEVDFPMVLERAKRISLDSRNSLREIMEKNKNPELIRGHARIVGKNKNDLFEIKIEGDVLQTKWIILNTGTRSLIPPIDGLDEIDFIDAGNWLEQTELPKHLAILGGGYIGLEMAQFYRRMGSKVTVIEECSQIADGEDLDVAEKLQEFLENEEIEFRLSTKVESIRQKKDKIEITFDSDKPAKMLTVSHIFIATGRKPNTDDLGLESIGVKLDEHGIVETDKHLATNVKGVWAAGDIRGGFQFTHTAWDDHRIIKSHILGNGSHTTKRIVPYAMFTDPELGRVGMNEKEAKNSGKKIKINCYEMKKNGKARDIGEPHGFIKVILDAKTEKILGATVLAYQGAEMVQGYVDLMNADKPFTNLRDSIHIHPTLFEAVQSSVKAFSD